VSLISQFVTFEGLENHLLQLTLEALHNEKDLLLQIALGNEMAFAHVVNHYWNKVYSICLTYVKLPETAEDISQEIFLKVWHKRESLGEIDSFDNYIFIVTRNTVVSALRKTSFQQNVQSEITDTIAASQMSAEDILASKDLTELLATAVGHLPPQQQKIWQLSRDAGLSHDEIAREMGISKNTVKVHLVRAINFIRTYLSQYLSLFIILINFF
jgi:RNA polymerase sigma-70 factor (family 1)